MKRIIAIFFLVIFSVSVTEAGQLFKLPLLIEHYIDHNQGGNKLSLTGFLKMHYSNSHQSDADEQEDNNLPFKTPACQLGSLTFIASGFYELRTQSVRVNTTYPLYLQPYSLKDPLSDIFHPPRLV